MNFFKLYIGDYQRDTGTLTLAEHGAYLLMLQHAYATEAPLPIGRELYRLLRAETKIERDAVDVVAGKFWANNGAGLVNPRVTEEIAKSQHQRTVNREIGKRGGRPKRTEPEPNDNRIGFVSVTEPEPNDNPIQTPDLRLPEEIPPEGADAPLAASPSDPDVAWLWRDGRKILAQRGMTPTASRSFIGKQLKTFTAQQVRAAITSADRAGTGDSASYVTAALVASIEQPHWSTQGVVL